MSLGLGIALATPVRTATLAAMKFISILATMLVMAAVLGFGIVAASKGSFVLLGVGLAGFVLLFSKFGCLSSH